MTPTDAGRSASVRRVLVIPLGEASRRDVAAAVARQFGDSTDVTWLDRRLVARRPLQALATRLAPRVFDAAVLVAPDLDQPRLRLTSFLLLLARSRGKWLIDLRGRRERWMLASHLAQHGPSIARHAAACALAYALGVPLLRLLDAIIRPREPRRPRAVQKLLYLRSQLWLGLAGGGSVAHTAGVIGGLTEAGVEVRVVSSDRLCGVAATTHVVAPELWFDGWRRELEDLAYNGAFFISALRLARAWRPDAIYQRHTAFNVAGAVLSRLIGIPLVLEFNSSEVWKGRYWGGLRLARAAALVERINLRAADQVVVVSRVLRDELLQRGYAPRIVVNLNGVDPRVFRPEVDGQAIRARYGFEPSDVVVGFSGTFGLWHGIPCLAQAVPKVLAARPNVRWLLIGDGPLRHVLDEALSGVPAADRAIRVGMLPHRDMPAYLAACDILVSPHGKQADGAEFFGSPTKLYEYMAMARPIVASAVGQIGEVLNDGRSALLVPPDDVGALSAAILRLVDDAELRQRLGRVAREDAEAHHTWLQNAQRVLQCLDHSQ